MGKRAIAVSGVQDPQSPELMSSLFRRSYAIELISAQQMRRLAKKEPVYLAVVRTTNEEAANAGNEPRNENTVSINEDKTQTLCPMQVQAILNDFADVFLRNLSTGLPPQRDLDHGIELVPGAEPPHRAPYRMSPQELTS